MCERIYFPEAEKLGEIIKIIRKDASGNLTAEEIMHDENTMTLKDIEISDSSMVIIIISETPLEGKVYRYGNHGPFWEKIGRTCGYA